MKKIALISNNEIIDTLDLNSSVLYLVLDALENDKSVEIVGCQSDLTKLYEFFKEYHLDKISIFLKERLVIEDYTVKALKNDFDESLLSKNYQKYFLDSIKKNYLLMMDNLFYELNFNEIYLDIFNGLNSSHIKKLYQEFEEIEDFIKKNYYLDNAFCYANSLEVDSNRLNYAIDKMLTLDFESPVNEIKEIKDFLRVYQEELDYDDLLYKVDFNQFKELLIFQKENLNDLDVILKFNQIFSYLGNVGAYNLIEKIKEDEYKDLIVASLDRSLIKYQMDMIDFDINLREGKSLLANTCFVRANNLIKKSFDKLEKAMNSVDLLIKSELSTFIEKPRKSKISKDFFKIVFSTKHDGFDYDYVIHLDSGEEVEGSTNVYLKKAEPNYEKIDYLDSFVKLAFKKSNHYANIDQDTKQISYQYLDKSYDFTYDYLLSDEDLFNLNSPRFISLYHLSTNYQKEINDFVKSISEPKTIFELEKVAFKKTQLLFDSYNFYQSKKAIKNIEELPKIIKKIIKFEGAITKKELLKRLGELRHNFSKKELAKAIDEFLLFEEIYNDNLHYYYKKTKFLIKDYEYVSDIVSFQFMEFCEIIKDHSYSLSFKEFLLVLKHYLNVKIRKIDESYLIEVYDKVF